MKEKTDTEKNMKNCLKDDTKDDIKEKRFLIFDLDGTVSNSAPGIIDSAEYALRKMGRPVPDRAFLARFSGPPLMYSFINYTGMSEAEAEKAVGFYREHYADRGLYNNSLYDGAEDFFNAAKARGKTLLIATAKPEIFVHKVLEYLRIGRFFDFVSAAGLMPREKSKAQIIARAMSDADADRESCVMIGDRVYDMEGARENGIPCVGIVNGSGFEEELKKSGALKVVKDFRELAGFLL